MARIKDTEYIYISSRIKALETKMLSKQDFEKMAYASSLDEAARVLTDKGWKPFAPQDSMSLEESIQAHRQETMDLLYKYSPDKTIIDVFRLKYDYSNLKALVKSQISGINPENAMLTGGMIAPDSMTNLFKTNQLKSADEHIALASDNAVSVLKRTSDPQLSDIELDKSMCAQMLDKAKQSKSKFLDGYIRLYIDLMNLKLIVRAQRAGKNDDFVSASFIQGGNISKPDFNEFKRDDIKHAFDAAQSAVNGGSLAAFDNACDELLIEYIKSSRKLIFGEAYVIAYLLSVEQEIVLVRTVMLCLISGMKGENIMERLQVNYV